MNEIILILPDSSSFKKDPRYGGSFKLINDKIHYLQLNKAIFQPLKYDYSIELWFKINHFSIIRKKDHNESLINPSLFAIAQLLNLQCDKNFLLLNGKQIIRYQPNQWSQIALV